MAEKYEKSTTEIAAGCILSLITMYNTITTVLTQAPKWLDTTVQIHENNEYINRIQTIPQYSSDQQAHQQLEERLHFSKSKLKETLEINPTQIDIFDTLVKKRTP